MSHALPQSASLGGLETPVAAALDDWHSNDKVRKLWDADASLWSNADEPQWLGWLRIAAEQRRHVRDLQRVADDVRGTGCDTVLLLGMGGSSLCPEVLSTTFGDRTSGPALRVLDSTVPAQVRRMAQSIDPARTMFVVSSKSGGTTEPNAFKQYFFDLVGQALGAEPAGSRFVAITDPGTKLEALARRDGFRHVLYGVPSIGGRYSALSHFGMAPAAILGIDIEDFLVRTEKMVDACGPDVTARDNPGVVLGVTLGVAALQGRDKVTLIVSPGIASLGGWLEQLIAESSGKLGKGLIPVDGENVAAPDVYGNDRVFVYLRLRDAADATQEKAIDRLRNAGAPVVTLDVDDVGDLGQEFFRWELATAVACSVLGVNAFDQPDVEASKVATRRLTEAFEASGNLAAESPWLTDAGVEVFADPANVATLGKPATLGEALAAHLSRIGAGDYFAVNAYVDRDDANHKLLQSIRHRVRDRLHVATTVGFGPRFLHSTGQLHKGGPNSGVFLQVTTQPTADLDVPDQKWSFGVLARFQAQGDLEVLIERQRRVVRVHLGADVEAGLQQLDRAVTTALKSR